MKKDKRDSGETHRIWLRYSHMGFEFALTFGIMVFIGYWLGGYWSIRPFGILVGALAGFGMALYQLIKSAQQMEREIIQAEKNEKEAGLANKKGEGNESPLPSGVRQSGKTEKADDNHDSRG